MVQNGLNFISIFDGGNTGVVKYKMECKKSNSYYSRENQDEQTYLKRKQNKFMLLFSTLLHSKCGLVFVCNIFALATMWVKE